MANPVQGSYIGAMRIKLFMAIFGFGWVLSAAIVRGEERPFARYIDPAPQHGQSTAVVVRGMALVHTGQFFPRDRDGKPLAGADALAQANAVLDRVEAALTSAGSGSDKLVKLNVYCASDEVAATVRGALAARFSGEVKPAVTYVSGKLADPQAAVAMDAVGAALPGDGTVRFFRETKSSHGSNRESVGAVAPVGGRVYVAGQAEPGQTRVATRATLESLRRTLDFVGLQLSSVVQVKTFINPIEEADQAREEIEAFFGDRVPPLVFVEWLAANSLEIELVAASPAGAGPADPQDVDFLTPPDMKASPVFSRLTRVRSDATIYVSGLVGDAPNRDGEGQVLEIFSKLKRTLESCGADMSRLVKATYYVTDDEASAALGKVRLEVYDPKRPPSASKATVTGVGQASRSVTLDMIAIPRESEGDVVRYDPIGAYREHSSHGWRVLLHRSLDDPARVPTRDETLELLADHLYRVSRAVPEQALARLREVPIWLEYAHPRHPCMCYHPSADWLRENGMNPAKAGAVELANCRNFLDWTHDQPWMVLHELAHAYHDRTLGFDHAAVRAEFDRAKRDGIYESVLRIGGSRERSYALTNPQEYFAEASEAFFGTNDFYPFTRAELAEYDPGMFRLLEELWGKAD